MSPSLLQLLLQLLLKLLLVRNKWIRIHLYTSSSSPHTLVAHTLQKKSIIFSFFQERQKKGDSKLSSRFRRATWYRKKHGCAEGVMRYVACAVRCSFLTCFFVISRRVRPGYSQKGNPAAREATSDLLWSGNGQRSRVKGTGRALSCHRHGLCTTQLRLPDL